MLIACRKARHNSNVVSASGHYGLICNRVLVKELLSLRPEMTSVYPNVTGTSNLGLSGLVAGIVY
jgi:hypothetical protein